jgi:hypothetical protein
VEEKSYLILNRDYFYPLYLARALRYINLELLGAAICLLSTVESNEDPVLASNAFFQLL